MASSKGESKPPKIMDVARPGKAAPPASARPIIVTNRPILKRDPMMAPSADATPDMEKPAGKAAPVSRLAKTIKVASADTGELASSLVEPAQPAEQAAATVSDTNTSPQTHASPDAAVALEVGEEALASLEASQDVVSEAEVATEQPQSGQLMIEPSVEPQQVKPLQPAAETAEPAPEINPVPDAPEPTTADSTEAPEPAVGTPEQPIGEHDDAAPADTAPAPEQAEESAPEPTEGPGPTEGQEPPAEPATSDTAPADQEDPPAAAEPEAPAAGEEAEASPASTAESDSQLAPNQIHADAKRKLDQAAAERQMELDKLIASKQYFLPIASHEKRRGTMRAALVLLLVIVLAVVWFDAVLDAGIVHLPGITAPTHFFSQK